MDKKQAQKYVKAVQRLVDKVQPGGTVSTVELGRGYASMIIKYDDPAKASILPIQYWDEIQEAVEGNLSLVRLQQKSVVLEFIGDENADAMNKLGRLHPVHEESAGD